MIVRGAAVRPSATILRSIECETAIRWSIDDVSRMQLLLVVARADARRVDGRDDPRPPVAGLAQRDRRLRAHDLGAVHVVVDDLGADVDQVRGEDAGRDRVVGLVDHASPGCRAARACARRCPARARRPRRRSARGPCARSGCTGAPARRRWCRSRGPRRRGSDRSAARWIAARARGRGCSRRWASSALRSPNEHPLDWLVDGAPLVLVGLVAAQEVEPADRRARGRAGCSARP